MSNSENKAPISRLSNALQSEPNSEVKDADKAYDKEEEVKKAYNEEKKVKKAYDKEEKVEITNSRTRVILFTKLNDLSDLDTLTLVPKKVGKARVPTPKRVFKSIKVVVPPLAFVKIKITLNTIIVVIPDLYFKPLSILPRIKTLLILIKRNDNGDLDVYVDYRLSLKITVIQ